ncbi:glycogen synthase GlgA [Porphyrobacter sp. YT40]|uniref:glycogen synthase GlgA n=1 Tax=Porphyrobacter sp. YT40 TaxID=2547601 RepID=UPI00114187C8|nr:glycogen synthase GlgA [Porphyrobacter sp. YT40]QDH33656.1 glycogen synthase GlgA [Porphyrobacter sp. YT40]
MSMKVLSVASEAAGLVKTGGLADVAGALPAALAAQGVAVTTFVPGYPAVLAKLGKKPQAVHKWDALLGTPARLLAGKLGDHPLLVLDAPALFAREGGPYADPSGRDWDDNWHRFAAFARAAADIAGGALKGHDFDLVHAHDWQAGLVPAYLRLAPLKGGRAVPSVMTIHNMAFQGYYPAEVFPKLGLPPSAWTVDGVESYGGVGFLKAGMQLADAITTVSPTYAGEIRSVEFGMGLEGIVLARSNRVHGILNGIDTAEWNPATDPHLVANFTAATLAARRKNKRAIEKEFSLDRGDGPLFVVVTRLTWQKGMDVLAGVLDHLAGIGARLALLGSGESEIEQAFLAAAARHPGRIGVRIGYDEALSHRLQAGGDAILIPSRFEPCGLTQLYGLAYGCVPVVARTGGLADTVIDANPAALAAGVATGIQMNAVSHNALAMAVSRAVELYHHPAEWKRLQKNGMKADFSWGASGAAYAALYRQLIEEQA